MFISYFDSIFKELNILIDQYLLNYGSMFDNSIIAAVHKHKRHLSILKIREKVKKRPFYFYHINPDKMLTILQDVDSKKGIQQGDTPVRITKENKFTLSKILLEVFNFYIGNNNFP